MAIWTPSTKTKTKKLKEEGCKLIYEVEVPPARLQDAVNNFFVRIQMKARLPGFRQGKAPLDLVKKQFGAQAKTEAMEDLVKDVVNELIKEQDLRPVATPAVSDLSALADKPIKFKVHLEVLPKFEPKGYKGIAVTKKEYPTKDEDVDTRLKHLQEGNARLETVTEEQLGKEHYAIVDFELSRDGKPLEGGGGKAELVDMSSDQSIEGLVEGLMGAKRQETREFEVKIGGKPTQCKMTVQEIKKKIVPPLDDSFAKDMGFEALAELKEKLRDLVVKENTVKSERELQQELERAILDANRFEVPVTFADQQVESMLERQLERIGPAKDKLKEKDLEELRTKMRPVAEDSVRMQFLVAEIVRVEKIEATDDDLKKDLEVQLARAQTEAQKKETQELFDKRPDDIRALIRERKAFQLIRDAAKVTTVKA